MDSSDRRGNVWAIVLAAGEGSRLSTLTRSLHGRHVPKQFASLWGDRTFLNRTLDRVGWLVPRERTLVVVADDCKALAEAHLRDYSGVDAVYQPSNRGTGAGVLLPLAHVLARDPGACVVIFPSDHHVEREAPFQDAIRHAVQATDFASSHVAMIGATAESPATDLGWIDCGEDLACSAIRASRVQAFVEKPAASIAVDLLRHGAMWNTMIVAARGQALWDLADRHIPEVCWCFQTYRILLGEGREDGFLRGIYPGLPITDLCRDVLQPAKGLAVVPMTDAGWSDCGTPERLFRAMEPSHEGARLLLRIERSDPTFDDVSGAGWRKRLEAHRAN
jgi:mannose-1-phosphate guanylyltransferase